MDVVPRNSRETNRSTARIAAGGNVIEHVRIFVENGIKKSEPIFASIEAYFIDAVDE